MENLYTRDEVDTILQRGYPTDEQLDRFPLGKALKLIPAVNLPYGIHKDKKGRENPGHIRRVLKGMNILLGEEPYEIVDEWKNPKRSIKETLKFSKTHTQIFHGEDVFPSYCQLRREDVGPFFRLCVMYHDIGKSIIHERHPLVGWHLIQDVYKEDAEKYLYPLLLGIPYERWAEPRTEYQRRLISIFDAVIKFHDLFGVLSTGEASLPVMVDLIKLTRTEPVDAKELFSMLMVFNLADLFGSVKVVHPYKVNYFCDDLEILCSAIEKAEGKRSEFFEILREKAQGTDETIERLSRFLNEGAPDVWRGEPIMASIVDAFRGATIGGMHAFCRNFAMFCKLDYALSFKISIMDAAFKKRQEPEVTNSMAKILWLLVQLEKQYGDLCRRRDGSWRRIGLELAGLTRKPPGQDDSRIGDTICDLLLKDKGKDWAAGECTVWFMEE